MLNLPVIPAEWMKERVVDIRRSSFYDEVVRLLFSEKRTHVHTKRMLPLLLSLGDCRSVIQRLRR